MLKKVEGKFGMSATLLAYSISPAGVKIATFELEYPRMILAELNTHRMLCRNSASSRAIPFKKMVEQLRARPVRFGEANPGMQDKGADYNATILLDALDVVRGTGDDDAGSLLGVTADATPEQAWAAARGRAVEVAEAFYEAGYHKQVYNRLLEPFQMMKTIVTATELANFLWLRDHEAADPTIEYLAKLIRECIEGQEPTLLDPGEWHLPYIKAVRNPSTGAMGYFIEAKEEGYWIALDEKEAIEVSSARTAAVSFRNVDYGVEKSREVHARLIGDDRKHASALEHQATPMRPPEYSAGTDWYNDARVNVAWAPNTWQSGVSHSDRNMQLWSGPLRGWIQYRKLIPGENVPGFDLEV